MPISEQTNIDDVITGTRSLPRPSDLLTVIRSVSSSIRSWTSQQWCHSAAGVVSSHSQRDCHCLRVEPGDKQRPCPHREGGRDWHSHWRSRECLDPGQHALIFFLIIYPTWPSSCPMVLRGCWDDTFKDDPPSAPSHHWAFSTAECVGLGSGLEVDFWENRQEVDSTQPRLQIAWPQRAARDRAASVSGGKRRIQDSWINLANCLEERRRRGARWDGASGGR